MRGGWKKCTLADVCDIRSTLVDPRADRYLDLPHVGAGNIESNTGRLQDVKSAREEQLISGKFLFDDSMVLYSKIRPYLMKAVRPDFSGLCSADIYPLAPRTGLAHRDFIFYLLLTDSFTKYAIKGSARAGMPKVNREHLFTYETLLPPVEEQHRIVAILDEAFDGIATAKANAEKNLQNARALFESQLQSIFNQRGDSWIDTGKPLSELCDLIVDCEHKTAPTQDRGIPSIRTPNIGKGKLLLDGVYRVSEETYHQWTRRAEPLAGDLILAREAPAGNVTVIPENTKVCLGQRTVLIRPDRRVFEPEFLALALLQPTMQQKLLDHSRGATVQHVNMKDIRALDLGAIPSLHVQRDMVSAVAQASQSTQRLESIYQKKLAALDELKKSLLHQAFSGQL